MKLTSQLYGVLLGALALGGGMFAQSSLAGAAEAASLTAKKKGGNAGDSEDGAVVINTLSPLVADDDIDDLHHDSPADDDNVELTAKRRLGRQSTQLSTPGPSVGTGPVNRL